MTPRRIRSKAGMSQMDALVSLQRIARENNEEIVDWAREGQTWVAALRTIAEFPPAGGDEGPDGPPSGDDGPPKAPKPAGEDNGEGESGPPKLDGDSDGDDDGSTGPPKPPGEKSEHGKGGGEHEVLGILHQLLQGLQQAGIIQGGMDQKMVPGMGPDMPPPPGPPKPPGGPAGPPPGHAGPPPGAGGPPPGGAGQPYGTKLKPGEVPNKPGVVPVGAPSFASTRQADSQYSWSPAGGQGTTQPATSPVQPSAPSGNPGMMLNPPCSKCGGPTQGGICPRCAQAAGGAPNGQPGAPGVTAKRVFSVESSVRMSPAEAHRELNAAYNPQGFGVSQMTPQPNGSIRVELTEF